MWHLLSTPSIELKRLNTPRRPDIYFTWWRSFVRPSNRTLPGMGSLQSLRLRRQQSGRPREDACVGEQRLKGITHRALNDTELSRHPASDLVLNLEVSNSKSFLFLLQILTSHSSDAGEFSIPTFRRQPLRL
jgi:hypothetical protein